MQERLKTLLGLMLLAAIGYFVWGKMVTVFKEEPRRASGNAPRPFSLPGGTRDDAGEREFRDIFLKPDRNRYVAPHTLEARRAVAAERTRLRMALQVSQYRRAWNALNQVEQDEYIDAVIVRESRTRVRVDYPLPDLAFVNPAAQTSDPFADNPVIPPLIPLPPP